MVLAKIDGNVHDSFMPSKSNICVGNNNNIIKKNENGGNYKVSPDEK